MRRIGDLRDFEPMGTEATDEPRRYSERERRGRRVRTARGGNGR